MKGWISGGLAVAALAAALAAPEPSTPTRASGERSLVESLLLLRWGHGAFDWASTDSSSTREKT